MATQLEIIDSAELAKRWNVPKSWVANRTRARTPKEEKIPCIRLGKYVRFQWGSERLEQWLTKHCAKGGLSGQRIHTSSKGGSRETSKASGPTHTHRR